jgi:lipopolysaccharide transport system ATP-binding protein
MISHQSGEKYTALRDVMANGAKRLGKKLLSPFTFHKVLNSQASNSQVLNSQVLNSQASNSQSPDSQASNSQASNSQSPDSQSPDSPFTASQEEFFALKDVSFEIKQGDRVGIIGRNGAGKSTLLKILSRITEPTSGRIEITGRVASLLEVGTGFHPELTGRENIFLNGAILGMGKAEIKRKFDEIVNFAEVERFLDTPVKRYSSGMYVRLAFAVAAHLEPEILIVDEVLAVGDAQFQKKCLGKMEEVGREGRTVLFVSHNMGAVRSLCTEGVYLENGIIKKSGPISLVINDYVSMGIQYLCGEVKWPSNQMPGDADLKLLKIATLFDNSIESYFNDDSNIDIFIEVSASKDLPNVAIGLIVSNLNGQAILHSGSNLSRSSVMLKKGINKIIYSIPPSLLKRGQYTITIGAAIPTVYSFFRESDVISFHVISSDPEIIRHDESAWKGLISPHIGTWYKL